MSYIAGRIICPSMLLVFGSVLIDCKVCKSVNMLLLLMDGRGGDVEDEAFTVEEVFAPVWIKLIPIMFDMLLSLIMLLEVELDLY